MRLIGVGSELRGDDRAGLEVARRLAAVDPDGLEVRTCGGGAAELLDALDGADDVLLVDAMRSGRTPGAIVELSGAQARQARHGQGTHDAGVADALALATALGRAPASVRIVGIEAGTTAIGDERLSPAVEGAVTALVASLSGPARQRSPSSSIAW